MAHPQWTKLLETELGRAEREDMWVDLTNILWAKELLKSINCGGGGGGCSLCHFKGHKTPPRGKLKDWNIFTNASPLKLIGNVSPFALSVPVGSAQSLKDGWCES